MKIEFRKKLFELLFKDKQVITDRDRSLEISEKKDEIARKSFMYRRHENVKIDDSFKYYHFELTGNLSKDFKYLYGRNDIHNSKNILNHSLVDNVLRIRRSHDIMLHKKDDVYTIYNGRHRLVYLSYYYHKIYPTNGFEAPAIVTREFEDDKINGILEALMNDFEAKIYKYNYYDDEAAFCIVLENNIYVVNNASELEEFYTSINTDKSKFHYSKLIDRTKIVFNELFKKISEMVGDKFFEMTFLDLLNFIRDEEIFVNGSKVEVENLDINNFYNYYFDISHNVQYCRIHNHEIPNGVGVLNAIFLPINRCGHMIMEFLYENTEYKNLTWRELYEIIHVFPEFEEFDSTLLLESAKRFGYVEGSGKGVQKRKKDYLC